MDTEKLLALMTLKRVPNLGDSSIKKLVREVGSPIQVLKEKKQNLLKVDGIGKLKIKEIHNPVFQVEAEKELSFVQRENIDCYIYNESSYPDRLKQCIDGPTVLFSKGNINLKQQKVISIVGTRNITTHGTAFCEELIGALAPLNPVIVSGLAYGVDICAHKAALENNLQTVACLAHGLNQIYPKVHKKYASKIEENGGLFTEYWSTDAFDRKNFLGRNRIIAGLSEATIVIESADKGGSLVTAELANSYHRDVFAVPGRTTDTYSKGCNTLIKTQKAHLLTSAADLLYILNWKPEEAVESKASIQKQLFVDLEPQEQRLYDFLVTNGKEQLDVIALRCKMPTHQTASLLISMELKGVLRPLPGKVFEVI